MFIKGFIFTIGVIAALVVIDVVLAVAEILGVLICVIFLFFYELFKDLFNPADTKPNRLKEKYEGSITNLRKKK